MALILYVVCSIFGILYKVFQPLGLVREDVNFVSEIECCDLIGFFPFQV